MRLAITALAAVLVAIPAQADQTYDLRGPAPAAGDVVTSRMTITGDDGDFSLTKDGDIQVQGVGMAKHHQTIQTTILETRENVVTKVRLFHVLSSSMTAFSIGEIEQPFQRTDTSMQGGVLTAERGEDGWNVTESEGVPDHRQFAYYTDRRLVYPGKPVKVGDKWEITDADTASFFQQETLPNASYAGKAKLTLSEIKQTDKGPVAVIKYEIQATRTTETSGADSAITSIVELKGEGTIERGLTQFSERSKFKGSFDDITQINEASTLTKSATKLKVEISASHDAGPVEAEVKKAG